MRSYLVLGAVILFLSLALLGSYAIRNTIGDLRPVALPSSTPIGHSPSPTQSPTTDNTQPDSPRIQGNTQGSLKLPAGLKLGVFAEGLGAPRDLEWSPGGTLLVSIPSQGKIVALPDKNGDGVADLVKTVASGLDKPHGIAFKDNLLFVAELRRVGRFTWDESSLTATNNRELFTMPYNGGHNTRHLVFNKKRRSLCHLGLLVQCLLRKT